MKLLPFYDDGCCVLGNEEKNGHVYSRIKSDAHCQNALKGRNFTIGKRGDCSYFTMNSVKLGKL